jgi:hypothetical protein
MDRRRSPRIPTFFPVRIWGVDAHCLPFMQLATVKNVSDGGAVVQGLRRRVKTGEILEVQSEEGKAQYQGAEIGLQRLPAEPDILRYSFAGCHQFVVTAVPALS